jgi:preprotein translocase subunit SecG
MLFGIIIVLHALVCVFLILLVLVQSDKGGGLAGAFGGMGGGVNTVFGGRGTANLLTKLTTGFATGFMAVALILNLLVAHRSSTQVKTMLQNRAERVQKMAPSAALPMDAMDPSEGGPSAIPAPPVAPGQPSEGNQGE